MTIKRDTVTESAILSAHVVDYVKLDLWLCRRDNSLGSDEDKIQSVPQGLSITKRHDPSA
jgi:hypothetical protein